MTAQNPSRSATLQSLSRMALLFKAQAKILDDVLGNKVSDSDLYLLPLLGAIRDNCRAILLCEKAGLSNEITLIQHLFVQRIINCCYLLNADKDAIAHYISSLLAAASCASKEPDAESFIEFARSYKPNDSRSAIKLSLTEQVEVIAVKSGIPKDLFLLALGSIFPKSTEILAGSMYGSAFHLGFFELDEEESKSADKRAVEANGELFYSLYLGVRLLDALFKTLARTQPIDPENKSSSNAQASDKLTKGLLGTGVSDLSHADGAWERLGKIEFGVTEYFENQLSDFAPAFKDTYDAGLIAPALSKSSETSIDLSFASLFLNRLLKDLRAIWNLLVSGYTSQAASIAASLYESSLAANCLATSKKNIDEFRAVPNGRLPWKIKLMAEKIAQANKTVATDLERKALSEVIYKQYSWLCDIKHASHGSIIHDTGASRLPGRGYVVMAIPNLSEDDLTRKVSIALISLISTLDSVESFTKALGHTDKLPDEFGFSQTYQRAREATHLLFGKYLEAPKK